MTYRILCNALLYIVQSDRIGFHDAALNNS